MMNQVYCIIVGSTVTAICSTTMANQNCVTGAGTNVMPVPPTALTIGGTLTTTNVIMANWSREMWQSVVNRVVRSLASGPFGSNFVTASGVVT
uniref:Secreted protein n=2 Tax=Angiostrongylus cantonensis TaxID=6313 RepID=A0A0K0DLJ2_ANGCA